MTNTQELILAPETPGEAPMKQLAPFDEFRAKAEKLKVTAETLTVSDVKDRAGMAMARSTRLALKEIRVAVGHRHRELKESILAEGQRLDAGKRELLALIEPLETRMLECEEFAEREAVRLEDERRTARHTALTPFLTAPVAVDIGKMEEADWVQMLSSFREAHEARIAAAAKAEAERIAKEKAEAEERERIRLENERLKKEAEEREAAARKEREEAAARLKAEQDKAKREALEADAKAQKEAKRIREEAEDKAKEAAEKARKEREAIEAEAAKENARLAAIAEKQRQETAALHAELKRKQAAEDKAALERKHAEEAAELAPEKEKLKALAKTIRELHLPVLKTDKGVAAVVEIAAKVEVFADWVSKKADAL